jgi:hypothetical protein
MTLATEANNHRIQLGCDPGMDVFSPNAVFMRLALRRQDQPRSFGSDHFSRQTVFVDE